LTINRNFDNIDREASTFIKIINNLHMKYVNHNPKAKRAGDCVIRAIAGATGTPWDTVLDGLVRHAHELHVAPTEKECYSAYLTELGWTRQGQPKIKNGKRTTAKELAKQHDAIIRQAHHLTFSQAGHIVDTWDCENRTVYDYYIKE
jgi:hypothetical protein